jgi:hypothetical protein
MFNVNLSSAALRFSLLALRFCAKLADIAGPLIAQKSPFSASNRNLDTSYPHNTHRQSLLPLKLIEMP